VDQIPGCYLSGGLGGERAVGGGERVFVLRESVCQYSLAFVTNPALYFVGRRITDDVDVDPVICMWVHELLVL
jgi:hypothetical protein